MIITNNNSSFVEDLTIKVGTQISLKELGPPHFFLGIEVIPIRDGLFLNHHKYIRDLLARTNMDGAKDITTPLSTPIHFKTGLLVDSTKYHRVIGALQYLSLTQPDIKFSFNKLSQFIHCPATTH